mgnify:CR=1 FL=1
MIQRTVAYALVSGIAAFTCGATALANPQIEAGYTADIFVNGGGGIHDGVRVADLFEVIASKSWQAFGQEEGITFNLYAVHANGGAPTGDLFGDDQTVSGIETGFETTRVNEAWVQLAGARASFRAGLTQLNSEFDVLESANFFVNASHGMGLDIAQSGENGPIEFPFTGLAVRGDYAFTDNTKVRVILADAVPGDLDDPRRVAIGFDDEDGFLVVAEFERSGDWGKLLAGYWQYSEEFEAIGSPGLVDDGNAGGYVRGEVVVPTGGASGDLTIFGRLGLADGEFNKYDHYISGGLVRSGFWNARPDDAAGIAFTYGGVGDPAKRADDTLEDGELNIELSYAAQIAPRISLQPNIQYIINPAADSTIDDALALGVRLGVDLSF